MIMLWNLPTNTHQQLFLSSYFSIDPFILHLPERLRDSGLWRYALVAPIQSVHFLSYKLWINWYTVIMIQKLLTSEINLNWKSVCSTLPENQCLKFDTLCPSTQRSLIQLFRDGIGSYRSPRSLAKLSYHTESSVSTSLSFRNFLFTYAAGGVRSRTGVTPLGWGSFKQSTVQKKHPCQTYPYPNVFGKD